MSLGFQPMVPVSEIVRRTQPGLVHIDVPTGSGSGFVIDAEGYIITNAHVVQEHSTVTAKFVDGAEYTGTVVGKDEKIDLACIRIANAGPLSPLPLGDSDAVSVGEDVLAMGYPLADLLGGSPTVTRGIVSGKQRDEIQTDAAINPGNSGGPLVDPHGFVIGVNTSVIESVGGRNITGIGFAIPSNVVKERFAFLASGGTVRKSVPAASEDDDGGEWATHDVGLCGFSISLPDWWELYSAESGFALFVSGLNSLIVSLNFDGVGFDLYEEAYANRNNKITVSEKSDYEQLDRVSPLRQDHLFGEQSFDFDYWGENSGGMFVGKEVMSQQQSATGGHYLLEADLTVQQGTIEGELGLDTVLPLLLSRFIPWDVYWSDRYAWRISAAPGWKPNDNYPSSDVFLMLDAHDGLAFITLTVCDLDDDKPVADLCREEVADWLTRNDAWDEYEILSSHESPSDAHEWYRIALRYLVKDDHMPSFGIVQAGRSGGLEYVIRAVTNIDYVTDYAADMEHIMDSFRF